MKWSLVGACLVGLGASSWLWAQQAPPEPPPQRQPAQEEGFESNRLDYDKLANDYEEEAGRHRGISPPDIAPAGWIHDFDYQSDLKDYLQAKHALGVSEGKETFVYLYADWLQSCRAFREQAGRGDYAKLLASQQILLLDYNYFRELSNSRLSDLPIFIKAHAHGTLGPELHRPVPRRGGHPRKAYHALKKFLEES
ncbi:MAG: hypothetical protein R3348_06040 [Xanthomonadales bacterium]|nr:hypothetical protein [Xanthomonadales bacterium]